MLRVHKRVGKTPNQISSQYSRKEKQRDKRSTHLDLEAMVLGLESGNASGALEPCALKELGLSQWEGC